MGSWKEGMGRKPRLSFESEEAMAFLEKMNEASVAMNLASARAESAAKALNDASHRMERATAEAKRVAALKR